MAEKQQGTEEETALNEQEPSLEEMSDYEKPLGRKKTNTIVVAFAIAIAVYLVYAIIMSVL